MLAGIFMLKFKCPSEKLNRIVLKSSPHIIKRLQYSINDLTDEFVKAYKINLKIKRFLNLTPKLKEGEEGSTLK